MSLTKVDESVLTTTGVGAGTYGGSTNIPVIAVNAQGRITNASNASITTSVTLAGTTVPTGTVSLGGTLTFASNNGIVVSASGSTVTISSPQNLQTTGSPQFTNLTLTGDASITGNLSVQGTYTYSNTVTFQTVDSLIELSANNVADAVDIGFYGQYSGTSYTGLVRTAGGNYTLFKGLSAPTANSFGTINLGNFSTLRANVTGGVVSSLASAIAIADGGTNQTSFTNGTITYYNGTSIASLANTGTAGTYGSASYHPVITTDAYGRVSAVTNTAIAIDTSQVTSGTLSITRGGTNASSFSTGNVIIFNGTSFASLGNTTSSGSYGNTTTIPSITVDAYGRVTAVSNNTISTTISLSGTSGSGSVATGGTLTFASSNGFVASVSSSTVTLGTSQNLQSSSATTQFASLGIGTAASGTTGEIRATNNITAYYSDDRLKTKLGAIIGALAKVKTLNGFYYEANETAQALGYDIVREVGISAQEVQAVLPEIVVPAPIDEKYWTVRYERIVPLLIEAIKELSEEVERLKAK